MKKFPQFLTQSIKVGDYTGKFEPSDFIGENWIGCLLVGDKKVIWGRFISVNITEQTVSFLLKTIEEASNLQVGSSYSYLDGYWGERAELILDLPQVWKKQSFRPSNAVEDVTQGQRVLSKAGPNVQSGDVVVKDGWDHEHCALCWETISQYETPVAWRNSNDKWLCPACYETYLQPRSLDFINIEGNKSIPPNSPTVEL